MAPAARIAGRRGAGVPSAGGATGFLLPSSEARSRASAAPSSPARALCVRTRARPRRARQPALRRPVTGRGRPTLLDEGQYLCAERTIYRILAANQPVRERRNQRSHPCYTKPELVATGPNQTWSWDITRLRGPKRWTSFYLYVLLDIFSRCVVGWMVADRENAALAATLIEETCLKQGIEPQVLTLHSDRGAPMTSKCTAQLLADLGVTRSLSRPQVSDDNPFSEAQFKTLKYHPGFPGRFALPPPSPSAGRSSPGTTPSTAMPGSRCSPPMMSIITGHRIAGSARTYPASRLGPSPRTLRPRHPETRPASRSRLDQPTRHFHNRRNESVNRNRRCLKVVDRFRGPSLHCRMLAFRGRRDTAGPRKQPGPPPPATGPETLARPSSTACSGPARLATGASAPARFFDRKTRSP